MRKKFVPRRIPEPDMDMVIALGRMGFSYRHIAHSVYGNEDDATIRRIGYMLKWEDIKVSDYRNGRNDESRSITAALKRGLMSTDVVKAIRRARQDVESKMAVA